MLAGKLVIVHHYKTILSIMPKRAQRFGIFYYKTTKYQIWGNDYIKSCSPY